MMSAAQLGKITVSKLADVASFLGVAIQTVKQWRTGADPMPGTPGQFPLQEIVRWKVSKSPARASAGEQMQRLDLAKRAQEIRMGDLKYQKMLDQLVDVDIVEQLLAQIIVEHNALAAELSERIRQMIPAAGVTIGKHDADDIAENVEQLVEELGRTMSSGLEEWAKYLEGGEDEESEGDD